MAFPSAQILGTVYTPGGALVLAGKITAKLYPQGQTAPDTSSSSKYKIAGETQAAIVGGSISGLTLVPTASLSHASAFYIIHFDSLDTPPSTWHRLWRIPTGVQTLSINSVTVLTNTPAL